MPTYPGAAKNIVVKFAASSGSTSTTWSAMGLLNEARLSHSAEMIDVSVFSSSQFKDYLAGLKDGTLTFSGLYAGTSDAGFSIVRDSWLNDSALWMTFLHDGSTGFKAQVKVSDFEVGGGIGTGVEFSATMQVTGSVGVST